MQTLDGTSRIYYNDNEPSACAWLRELMADGLIPPGVVDQRSITEIDPDELDQYTQCHFFAGIGGWAYALRLAGWPDNRPVWTGSCPCQPFSSAGKQRGTDDERHLWPAFACLIGKCQPSTVFGEQVASKAGRDWLAGVFTDLEGMGYAAAGADLCAASVGAPHIRQRLWWVADSEDLRRVKEQQDAARDCKRTQEKRPHRRTPQHGSDCQWLGNADMQGPQGRVEYRGSTDQWSAWSSGVALVKCVEPTRDGGAVTKYRRAPTEPGLFPLADGIPGRVGILRGAGNAIVPQVAAAFVSAYMEATS